MDAHEAIMTTRAMRRLADTPVADDDLMACLEAAQQAPSGGNVQPQQYVVIRDEVMRSKVAAVYLKSYDRYERCVPEPDFRSERERDVYERTRRASRYLADNLANAPVIVMFLQPIIPWGFDDEQGHVDIGRLDASVYPAVQNFCIAARARGLGTAFTTVIRVFHDEALEIIGAPEGRFEIAALVPVGYPIGTFGRAPRKDIRRAIHLDRYGTRPSLEDGR